CAREYTTGWGFDYW
nr:immunoglobulin heavy chain junction region [Macaca mulatta]MOV49470.1 immunoglobulin heavy chain junction region [Macaca mulatta]MOV49727.1 immunoglobulin heavy chain junction region [Macaca mulatta]MOV50459.1 immunoglobulin heavy chain junction region [Macaca mulatta]MOV50548.1 immunoglobulin heavy chain junction region [Macaca mulatta]